MALASFPMRTTKTGSPTATSTNSVAGMVWAVRPSGRSNRSTTVACSFRQRPSSMPAGFYYVATQRRHHPDARVFLLSGYSCGGAAVIAAARWLQRLGLIVDALFLFDAVDRSLPVDGYIISSNVKQACHA